MSEIETAILTGSFAVLGILSGAIIEMLRERWKYNRTNKRKQIETQELNKSTFLSPLCFYVNKNLLIIPQHSDNMEVFRDKVCETMKGNIVAIEELMKNHMHLMSKKMFQDLKIYVQCLDATCTYVDKTKISFEKLKDEQKKKQFDRDKHFWLSLTERINDMTAEWRTRYISL